MGYFRTDAEHDVAWSLEAAVRFFELSETQEHYWKWAVIAVHSALQGVIVLTLRQGDGLKVQKRGVAKRILAALERDEEVPLPYMDSFTNLYTRVQDPLNFSPGCAALNVDACRDRRVAMFNQLRDDFVHFNTKSWSIEIDAIYAGAAACVSVMQVLMGRGAIVWHEDQHLINASDCLTKLANLVESKQVESK